MCILQASADAGIRLDRERRRLQGIKDELLRESKTRLATMDKVKAQVDELMKARRSIHLVLIVY